MNTKQIKAISYLRKSTDDKEKQVLSLESQTEVTKRLESINDIYPSEERIVDKQTAKKPGRKGFNKMIELINQGKINTIISWSAHRLSRNAVDTATLIELMDQGKLLQVITESYTFRNTPMDKFMLSFQFAQAKFDNDNKAIDVKDGMTTCARKGIYPSCPPLGYLIDKGGIKGARKRDIDTLRFPIMRKMWDLMLAGTHTPYQILRIATDEWGLRNRQGNKLCKAQVYNIFNNPFYYGEFEWPKGSKMIYKGIHTPMVTKDEFDRVQRMLGKTGRARPIKHYFIYGGCSLHCSVCGCAIIGYRRIKKQQNGNVHEYTYYGCTKRKGVACNQKNLTESELESQVERLLESIQIPQSIHTYMMDWIRSQNKKQYEVIYAQNESNRQIYESALKKIDSLIDMRASGLINDAQFMEKKGETEKERDRLKELIMTIDNNVTKWVDTADKLFSFAELALKRFQEGGPETKRSLLINLGWNLQIKDKKLDLSREEWIRPVKQLANVLREEIPRLKPISALQNKENFENLLQSPLLCTLLDDVRTCLVKDTNRGWFNTL